MIKAPISVQSMNNQLLTLLTSQQKKSSLVTDVENISHEMYTFFKGVDLLLNNQFFFQISDKNTTYPYFLVNGFRLKNDGAIEFNHKQLQITLNNPNHVDFRLYDLEKNKHIFLKKLVTKDSFSIVLRKFISAQLSNYDFNYKHILDERYHGFRDIFSLVNTLGISTIQDLNLLDIKSNQYLPQKKDTFYTSESFYNQLLKNKDFLELNYDMQLPPIDKMKKQTYKKS